MDKGKKLAIFSVAAGVISFIQLLGIEKAVFAIIMGAIALKEIKLNNEAGSKAAYAGIILGVLYILVLAVIFVIKGPEIFNMIKHTAG